MRTSQAIALCVLSGAACGLLGAVLGADSEEGHASYRVRAARGDAIGLLEIREELQELRRSIDHLMQSVGRGGAGEGSAPTQHAVPRGGDDDLARRRELDTGIEKVWARALVRIDELIEAQQQATAQALRDASHRKTAEGMDRFVSEYMRGRDLEREKKLISRSRDIKYLRKMAAAD